jgi:hypothetical protein
MGIHNAKPGFMVIFLKKNLFDGGKANSMITTGISVANQC